MSFPAAFLSHVWVTVNEEGVDDYFKAKGTPWIVRKGIIASSHTLEWKDLGDGKYSVEHKAIGNISVYRFEFRVGEEFVDKRFDKSNYKILVTVEKDTVHESYEKVGDASEPMETYTFEIEGDKLKQTMKRADASCTLIYKTKD